VDLDPRRIVDGGGQRDRQVAGAFEELCV